MSPEPESGKTSALEVTALFVPTPRLSFSMSAASLVRIIARGHETGEIPDALYDEIDNLFSKSEEGIADLRGALNAGYRRGAVATRCINKGDGNCRLRLLRPSRCGWPADAARCVGNAVDLHSYEATSARRGEGEFPAQVSSGRSGADQARPDRLVRRDRAEADGLRAEDARSITDRTADIYEPLLSIADMAGGPWPKEAGAAAVYLTFAAKDDVFSSGRELLAHCREAFLEGDRIWASTLCQRLRERDESPWTDVKGKPLDERGLALRLKPYRIKSRDVKLDGTYRKGYFREDFHDAWKRYLATEPSATSATSATKLMNNNKKVAEVAEVALRTENSRSRSRSGLPVRGLWRELPGRPSRRLGRALAACGEAD